MTRYNTGRDGGSPFQRMSGKSSDGSTRKFGEQVHYKLSGRPSSRVGPRWELGAWIGKMELTDGHLLGTLAGIRSSRTIYRLPKSHCFNQDAFDRIVGTPTSQTVRPGIHRSGDSTSRRDGLTRTVSLLGCPRGEDRGTMSHSETCRKRFDAIEKKKLDKQLEEATWNAEPPPVFAAETDVEQPREQPSTGGTASSPVRAQSGQEAVPVSSPDGGH